MINLCKIIPSTAQNQLNSYYLDIVCRIAAQKCTPDRLWSFAARAKVLFGEHCAEKTRIVHVWREIQRQPGFPCWLSTVFGVANFFTAHKRRQV